MEGKKRYIAIVLFLLIGLTLFAFANPVEEEKGSKKKNGNGDETQEVSKDEDTDTQGTLETESEENTQAPVQAQIAQLAEDNSYANALEAVEKAEGTFDKDDIDSAKELIDQVTNDEQKQELAERIEIVEESLEVMTLVEKLEEMLNDSENKDDIEDTIDYRDDEEVEDKVDSLRNKEVKDALVKRLARINKVLNDTEAPKYSGVENNETTKEDVTLTVEDDTEVVVKVTLNGEEIEFTEDKPFTEEGVYEVLLIDEAFNETPITFTIDKTKPGIKSNWWKKTVEANKDAKFTDFPEFTITDKTEVTTEFIKGEVKMGVPGVYRLRYRFTDAAGNSIDKEVQVTVVDTTAPSVRSNWWKKTVEANKDAEFTDFPEFTLTDNAEGEIKTEFIKGEVKMGVPGVYRLRYRFTDAAGNSIDKEVQVTVVDTTAPLLTLNGEANVVLEAGIDTYEELGATVTDNVDETITDLKPAYIHYRDKNDKLEKVTSVDTTKVGTYKIVYKHTDSNNNIGVDAARKDHDYVMRTVIVQDTINPTLTVKEDSIGTDPYYSEVSFALSDSNKIDYFEVNGTKFDRTDAKWSDANYQNIKSALVEGENTITLYDTAGNKASKTFIMDWTDPVITISSTVGKAPHYSEMSFKLYDNNMIDYIEVNGVKFDRSNAKWSDANFQNIKSAVRNGENTIVLYDVAGNKSELVFTLDLVAPEISLRDGTIGNDPYFSKVNFGFYDNNLADKYVINGKEVDFGDAKYSNANYENFDQYLKAGENTITLYDTAGNKTTKAFVIGSQENNV